MKPFLSGKKDLGVLSLVTTSPALTIATAPSLRAEPAAVKSSGPTIDVIKEGGKVVRLVITCGCGERMEVECLYPAGA